MTSSIPLAQAASFYKTALGKKTVMAVTGVVGFGFVIGHLLGNLQFFLGPEVLNEYAASLRRQPGLLLLARAALLAAVLLHLIAALQLTMQNSAARPRAYRAWTPGKSTFASRTMKWSGLLLLFFIAYHLLHLTFGVVHPNFKHGPGGVPDAYHNVVAGFSSIPVSLAYIAAMICLGFHLSHGVWSMFQSIGWNHPRYMPIVRKLAVLAAILIVLGNISIPISVLLGFHDEL